MDANEVMAAFAFAKDKPLQLTRIDERDRKKQENLPISYPKDVSAEYPETKVPVIRFGPKGAYTGMYTDFPVENMSQDSQGSLVLSGPMGKAIFKVGA